MSGSNHSVQGVPCIGMERLDEGFPPTRNSNLRHAPASRDIACLTNLALLPLGRCDEANFLPWQLSVFKQGGSLASITGTSVFIFLLSFFGSLIGLAPLPLGFAHDTTTALVYQRACQYWVTDTPADETHRYVLFFASLTASPTIATPSSCG